MQNSVIHRIKEIKKKESHTNESFSEATGISLETIKSMFSKKTNPSVDTLMKIKSAFPLYSLDWIITGNGSMQKAAQISSNATTSMGDYNVVGVQGARDITMGPQNSKNEIEKYLKENDCLKKENYKIRNENKQLKNTLADKEEIIELLRNENKRLNEDLVKLKAR